MDVDGVAILLSRHPTSGAAVAIRNRCTHRGGPLHEGELADGCVTCPWHGSTFSLADGAVIAGPATRPQQAFEVREQDGRIAIRAESVRSLRNIPGAA